MTDARIVNPSASPRVQGAKRMLVGLIVAVSGSLALSAWAQPAPGGPGGHHGPRGGFGGPGFFMGNPEHAGRMIDRMLDGLNATEAQRTQIKQIAQSAASDLRAQHESARGLHEQAMALFSAPVVDARAVETLRQQQLAQHDQTSKRMTQAMLDISNVLTPEQRVKLAERMKKRADMMRERMNREHPGRLTK